MSDQIKHECGLALVRLRMPLVHYRDQYGDAAWGLRRLFLLMEKQHNRGQDGAGIAVVKTDMPPGEPFMRRLRSDRHNAIERVFDAVTKDLDNLNATRLQRAHDRALKSACHFLGDVNLGHLRYGTHSGRGLANCHPYVRKNISASRNMAIAGNFNMTNSHELFNQLLEYGLNPVGDSDTQVILERLGYFLDEAHRRLRGTMGPGSLWGLEGRDLADAISRDLDLVEILKKASNGWDGGYVFAGILGNGDSFVCRDPSGIRPGFYYINDEVIAAASERAALANVFNVEPEAVQPIPPGHVLAVKAGGTYRVEPFTDPLPLRQCSFERIYFSRGNDPDIYNERKTLGRNLAPRITEALDGDLDRAVFSYIPNTAESAYVGLMEEINHLHREQRINALWDRINSGKASRADLDEVVSGHVRAEKIAHKDQRLRTFITHDDARRDLVLHIYDITRGIVKPEDALVVLDDSIVRGTTLRESIITILSRLKPRSIVVASSAPPIMYPDCYGIDMSQLGRFIAFEAAIALLNERGDSELLDDIQQRCEAQQDLPPERMTNHVKEIYGRFTLDEMQDKIAQLVRPAGLDWQGEIKVIYQDIDGLRAAMPAHTGDWYFTGDYPTPGGNRVVNTSFLNWRRNKAHLRAYEK